MIATWCAPVALWPVVGCLLLFLILLAWFCWLNRTASSFYFDAQDLVHYDQGGGRILPVSAATGTFANHLKNYVDIMKLLITVAAASIAFGGIQNTKWQILVAKIVLAFAVLYGVVFCGFLQFYYELYSQNVRAYTPFRYALIQALGFSALACFIAGYFIWAFSLS